MIVEIRTYTFRSGTMAQYLAAFDRIGFALQKRHLGECLGFLTSETGPIEQVVQIFGYESWEDRDHRRAALYADASFKAMSEELHPLIQSKDSQIFRSVPFAAP
ncbi:NIPSNAP family protein [Chelatococcus asaccharovorans]|uniref:NIPSNAP family protein n=1 Tax=Chelatococcus asaccharovorans TaxID=28210 RepID=UPI00224C6820|nr:NIPSNAP family protein [Chelatococcus asaccharovorans]CAH1662380.1 NIPSNAP protein [Chelatococcus asaccharovorans]CAH1683189.1 NIPSNAP protein [Chelatococcus asaccharovorans]